MNDQAKPQRIHAGSGNRWVQVLLLALLGTAGVIGAFLLLVQPPPEVSSDPTLVDQERIEQAGAALNATRYELAKSTALQVASDSPFYERSRLIAGEAAMRLGSNAEAMTHYLEIADKTSSDALVAAFSVAELYRAEGRIEEAVSRYLHVYRNDPRDAATHERLAFLYGITGQRWESMPHYLGLIKTQQWTLDSLAMLGDIERAIEQPSYINTLKLQQPNDPWVRLAQAAWALTDGDEAIAKPLLQSVVRDRPNVIAAQAMLGEVLLSADEAEYRAWEAQLPSEANEHADIWFVRGVKARGAGEMRLATGNFAEAVRLRPEHRRATYQLSQVLALVNEPGAEKFVERTKQQVELGQAMDVILKSRGADPQSMRRASELSKEMGRYWEAWAWALTAAKMHPQETWMGPLVNQVGQSLSESLPRTIPSADLLTSVDLSSYVNEAQEHSVAKVVTSVPETSSSVSVAKIRFVEETDVGIDFTFDNGPDEATPGVRMFEQTGGGVGVIDFDADGWPDLYFTQGSPWKTGQTISTPSTDRHDALYRNVQGERFIEVSALAGIQDLDYSQGLAVGDYDADGFADIYVANIGQNQLWCNNGDGTFTKRTDMLGSQLTQWSTSCVMADFNGDGLSDLFEANYLQGEGVFEIICEEKGCSPKVFAGAPDQLYLNRGDGHFSLIPDATPKKESKGLGLLAAAFGKDAKLSLFVANDQVPNFFLTSEPTADGNIVFRDRALMRGLAYNVDGLAMACMGIAADDIDGNGRVDLLVTNFADEPNSLYLQDAPGLFVDATRASGMQGPSFPYVGWGTQFIDADCDGQMDVVVVNGHVADYRDRGGMYQMPPQFYHNIGRARFEVSAPAEVGEYFGKLFLGRGLARTDWNRDGRMDFVVSNIGMPASLVSNNTIDAGKSLQIKLHGTSSSRDAIGTRVTLATDKGQWTKQLVAGDGYMASNERMLQFGIAGSTEIRAITVQWPAGGRWEWSLTNATKVDPGMTLHIVEGMDRVVSEVSTAE